MKMLRGTLLLATALLPATASVAAETVYRCGPDGREYSAVPCAGGKTLQLDDSRTPAQQHEAQAAARRDAKLADQMARDRRARDAAAGKTAAARIGPTPAPAASSAAHGKKKKKPKVTPNRSSDLTPPLRASGS